jgi:membrane-bound metal-dependent hydrolase YbcI (DUF457 family)
MLRSGHIGLALLLASIASSIMGLGLVTTLWMAGATVLFSVLPDLDKRPGKHRQYTHSPAFAIAVSIAFGVAIYCAARAADMFAAQMIPRALARVLEGSGAFMMGFIPAAAGTLSHVFADMFTYQGVPLLLPFSGDRYSFSAFRSNNWAVNMAFSVLGTAAFVAVVLQIPPAMVM